MKALFNRVRSNSPAKTMQADEDMPLPSASTASTLDSQRLLAALEGGRTSGKAPSDERLRRIAAELVARVEARKERTTTTHPKIDSPATAQAKSQSPTTRPDAGTDGDRTPPQTRPGMSAPASVRPPIQPLRHAAERNSAPAPSSVDGNQANAPSGHATPAVQQSHAIPREGGSLSTAKARQVYARHTPRHAPDRPLPTVAPPKELGALVAQSERTGVLASEHPAVIAHGLKSRSRKQQAAALRTLPRSLARSVQRLLI